VSRRGCVGKKALERFSKRGIESGMKEQTVKRLQRANVELSEAKDIARAEKVKVKRAKANRSNKTEVRLKKSNAKRAMKTIEKGVEAIERKRELLIEDLAESVPAALAPAQRKRALARKRSRRARGRATRR
jgi:hypothetical protein